ncbi:hypothetical protein IVB41_27295 [Bradyrhizobium sp. 44]|uniref:hypothetical protein n=1 Tax=Bradyrhizobium sp. 44 TaxID=2782675 RepID=UPI001FF8BDCE|nr:hypothetical protein [Bradyrhizobium sp. 44]MCK1287614.1 hypothetical protein [Bradyrhizobium sp. 44]
MDEIVEEAFSAVQESRRRAPGREWPSIASPGIAITSLGVLAFIFLVEISFFLRITGELRDLIFYVICSLFLAPICAILRVFISRLGKGAAVEATHIWIAIMALSLLAVLPLFVRVLGGDEPLLFKTGRSLIAATCSAAILTVILNFTQRPLMPAFEQLRSTPVMVGAFFCALWAFLFSLFWIEPRAPFSNPITHFFSAFLKPTSGQVLVLLFAALTIFSLAALAKFETRMRDGATRHFQPIYRIGLGFAIGLTWLCYFDFSLPADALHNMTNIGPALHLRFGGVLMVDTFSQYGPGPVLVTLLGLTLGPTTVAMGNIVVQIQSLLFYSLWMVCLYRMSTLKLPSLLIGFLAIGFLMAGWGQGEGNINFAPSILGPRYLPILSMVLAISLLHPPARHSTLTAVSTMIAGLWSAEALIGSLGIHLAFLGMLGLRDRAIFRILSDGILACLPVLGAIATLSLLTLIQAGKLPNYHVYLDFMSVYGMLSPLWSLPANPLFLGWSAILLVIFLVLADGWLRIFDHSQQVTELSPAALYYQFLPMALLTILMSAYFVGRSVEYVIIIALLPFIALIVPGLLRTGTILAQSKHPASLLVFTLPVLVGLWALSFTFLTLTRQGSTYSLLIQECRDYGRCTPSTLVAGLKEKLRVRPVLDQVSAQWSRYYFDSSGTVREAVDAMQHLAADKPTVSVFLGSVLPTPLVGSIRDNIASDMALLYAGKWHRWPRSYGFSDDLIPALVDQIVSTPIRLNEGEIVIVRRDETTFGEIERRVLRKIRAETTLCLLPAQWKEIAVYRVGGDAGCPAQ